MVGGVTRYLIALAWYKTCYALAVLSGRRNKEAPGYLLSAYNRQARAWNRREQARERWEE